MSPASEACMAAARRYLMAAERFERCGLVALADTFGSIAADYIEAAQRIEDGPSLCAGAARAVLCAAGEVPA